MSHEPNTVEPAYAAGLIDGEGCIIVRFGTRRFADGMGRAFHVAIEVTNTHRGVLEALHRTYGGTFYSKHHGKNATAKLEAWAVRFTGSDCARLAHDILPYAIVKRSQIELLLEARELLRPHGGRSTLTVRDIAVRQDVVDRMLKAKKDGTVSRVPR